MEYGMVLDVIDESVEGNGRYAKVAPEALGIVRLKFHKDKIELRTFGNSVWV